MAGECDIISPVQGKDACRKRSESDDQLPHGSDSLPSRLQAPPTGPSPRENTSILRENRVCPPTILSENSLCPHDDMTRGMFREREFSQETPHNLNDRNKCSYQDRHRDTELSYQDPHKTKKSHQDVHTGDPRSNVPMDTLSVTDKALDCPECGSRELRKSGLAARADGSKIQRWLCLDCGFRFRPDHADRLKGFKEVGAIGGNRQVCVILQETKNLDPTATENRPAAGVPIEPRDGKSELLIYSWKMQKEGYGLETIRGNASALRAFLVRGANLADPESIKGALAREQTWSGNRRRNVINAYTLFLKFHGLKWEPPRYNIVRKIPFIPVEQEIDDLIAGCPPMISAFMQLLKETAMRSGEAKRLKWTDADFERRVITLNDPEKGSYPRIFNTLSGKLLGMLNSLPRY